MNTAYKNQVILQAIASCKKWNQVSLVAICAVMLRLSSEAAIQ